MSEDSIAVPTLDINTWGDQTIEGTLALAEQARHTSPSKAHHVIIAPGNHCGHDVEEETFGDLRVSHRNLPWFELYLRFFDQQLRGKGPGLADLPPYFYFMLGEDRWLSANSWPPEEVTLRRLYLSSGGRANGRSGNGLLSSTAPTAGGMDTYRHDPLDPVPSRGGPTCCTGNPDEKSGPSEQTDVETRQDVLVYTSPALEEPMRIAGPLTARLFVDTSADDTDFVARLTDVSPDGRSIALQEGALRLRYRHGVDSERPVRSGERYEIVVPMRSIAAHIPAGHRIRLQVASSSFPRLERNLGGAGPNLLSDQVVVAMNRVHYGPTAHSFITLPLLPSVDPKTTEATKGNR